ncbi:NUDIX hydrolase [Leptospira interrogans]|uniref:NUDIX hydrolase n=1 Tax=Leptospira interrogans TaxID=173 RepID=UPI0002B98F3A|nr:NUDIX domain-containing protein [Leptospira interrogans]MCR8648446.1 NUDIX hydrolase [Leptospira interrogans serovar Bataviae]OAM86114.1 NUDIX hydrolase [Leptospira interrogans serovar Bataviae]QOI40472.1 NUDIX hydrolase [Leptospira interrogans serovar Bataviae]
MKKNGTYTYDYARPSLTVDCVVFGIDEDKLKILIIQRALEPFRGHWALPGGFVRIDETIDEAASRELKEETGLKNIFLEQLYTFGQIDRDPRERVVSVAYYALVNLHNYSIQAATDADNARWQDVQVLPKLAFDHNKIVEMALTRLKGKVRYQPIGFELLPQKFTLTQLQRLYEIILGKNLDKRNFRKKILQFDILDATNEFEENVAHRAALLYQFNKAKYDKMVKRGFTFDL